MIFPQNEDEYGKVYFREIDGILWYGYFEPINYSSDGMVLNSYNTEGIIPEEIFALGYNAISAYATAKVNQEINSQKYLWKVQDDFDANPNFPLVTVYQGILLIGRIFKVFHSTLFVELLEPYRGKSNIHYGFASAMMGHHIFSDYLQFSDNAVKTAEKMLIEIYQKKKAEEANRNIIDAAERLNEQSNADSKGVS